MVQESFEDLHAWRDRVMSSGSVEDAFVAVVASKLDRADHASVTTAEAQVWRSAVPHLDTHSPSHPSPASHMLTSTHQSAPPPIHPAELQPDVGPATPL
jgi:hypothetical protein